MTKSYPTELTNDTKKALNVYELDGSILVVLAPGQSFDVESVNPETLYSRWSSVKWTDGKVSFLARTNFRQPDLGRWVLHCLNKDGAEVEFRTVGGEVRQVPEKDPLKGITTGDGVLHKPMKAEVVGGQRICLPRGVPVLVSCPLTSDLIMFQSLTICRKRIMVKSSDFVGYCTTRWVLRDEKEPRPDSELKALGKILDEVGKKK